MKWKRTWALLLTVVWTMVACTGVLATPAEVPGEKEETVYVIADANGAPSSILVSTWLQNPKGAGTLSDRSQLSDLEVLKGDATYSLDKDGALLWQADGQDVYYRGSAQEPLPVELTLSYFLDGTPISAQDLAGKAGQVTIQFTYENTTKHAVTIGDQTEELPIPFLVLSGLMLDGKDFSNVATKGGQVISDGDRFFVAGFAVPGLREDLGEAGKDLELPETVTVTADTTNFHLDTTFTLVVTDLFQGLDLEKLDSLDALTDSLHELDEGAQQLLEGSGALYEGLETLLDSTGTLRSGTQDLYDGSATLYAGLRELQGSCPALAQGMDQLAGGAGALQQGLGTLSDGAGALQSGIGQVDAGAAALQAGLVELQEKTGSLTGGVDQLQQGADRLHSGLERLQEQSGQFQSGANQLNQGAAQVHTGAAELSQGGGIAGRRRGYPGGSTGNPDPGGRRIDERLPPGDPGHVGPPGGDADPGLWRGSAPGGDGIGGFWTDLQRGRRRTDAPGPL